MATKKTIKYSEPKEYMPKSIFDKYFKEEKKPATKKTGKKKK